MKKIEALVRPYMLDDIMAALDGIGIERVPTTEVIVRGGAVRSRLTGIDCEPMIKIELAVPDGEARKVVSAITAAVHVVAKSNRTAADLASTITVLPLDSHHTVREIFKYSAPQPA